MERHTPPSTNAAHTEALKEAEVELRHFADTITLENRATYPAKLRALVLRYRTTGAPGKPLYQLLYGLKQEYDDDNRDLVDSVFSAIMGRMYASGPEDQGIRFWDLAQSARALTEAGEPLARHMYTFPIMEARLSFITLGVADLEKSKAFYGDVLGWKPFQDSGGIVMYKLNGMVLSLFPQHELAEDAQVKDDGKGARFTLAQCLRSAGEVDALFADLKKKGVTITKMPVKVFWGGYSGYFADPDGHLWEIAHNPFLEMDADGNVLGMKQG